MSPWMAPPPEADFNQLSTEHLVRYGPKLSHRVIVKAQGSILWDAEGNEIIDFTSGQMSALLGHSNPAIVEAVSESMNSVNHLFSGFVSPPLMEFAAELASVLPESLSKTILLTTGAEANEAAIKMAKLYTGKWEVVAFAGSWHGMTQGAAAATFSAGRKGYGPTVPGQFVLPTPKAFGTRWINPADGSYDWQSELKYAWEMIDCQSTGNLACCIIEPILSSGGIIELPIGYMEALKGYCEERGMLLLVDEAQTGLGRTGDMFAFEQSTVVPDILILSKTLGCGLPVSSVTTSALIESTCFDRGFLFYTTHVSDPLAANVALRALKIVKEENLKERAKLAGKRIKNGLLALQKIYPSIGDVRGRGLLLGMELISDGSGLTGEEIGRNLSAHALDLGLSVNIVQLPGMSSVIRIAPPITISDEQIDRALAIFAKSFKLMGVKGGN